MEFVVGILLLLTFFGLAYYCIKGHNLMIGFLIITILWTALSFLGAAFASPEFLSTTKGLCPSSAAQNVECCYRCECWP